MPSCSSSTESWSYRKPSPSAVALHSLQTLILFQNGLRLALAVHPGLSLLSPEIGLRVVVHNPYHLPVPDEQGFNVGPGASSVSVSRVSMLRCILIFNLFVKWRVSCYYQCGLGSSKFFFSVIVSPVFPYFRIGEMGAKGHGRAVLL